MRAWVAVRNSSPIRATLHDRLEALWTTQTFNDPLNLSTQTSFYQYQYTLAFSEPTTARTSLLPALAPFQPPQVQSGDLLGRLCARRVPRADA